MAMEEYDVDVATCSSLPAINSDMVDWRVSSVNACVTEYLRNGKECSEIDDVNVGGFRKR